MHENVDVFPEGLLAQIATVIPAVQAAEQRLDRELGSRFNAFVLFKFDESASSRMLSFLLDPLETHGQAEIFLRLFMQRFVPKWESRFDYSEARRSSTGARIDVTITDNLCWLGIENKFKGTVDQETQVDRYLTALRESARGTHDYFLLYLSPSGKEPADRSYTAEERREHPDKLLLGAWVAEPGKPDILEWLSDCQKECRADNVRSFLRQFSAQVRLEITGQREPDMADATIISLALKNEQNLEGALRISANAEDIRNGVLRPSLHAIEAGLTHLADEKGPDWEVRGLRGDWPKGQWSDNPSAKWLPILLRRRHWPNMVGAAILADSDGPRLVKTGIGAVTEHAWDNDKYRRSRSATE